MVRGAFSLGDRGGGTGNGRHVVAQSNRSDSTHNPFKAQHPVLMNVRRHPEIQATEGCDDSTAGRVGDCEYFRSRVKHFDRKYRLRLGSDCFELNVDLDLDLASHICLLGFKPTNTHGSHWSRQAFPAIE